MSSDILEYIRNLDKLDICGIMVLIPAYFIYRESSSEIIKGEVDFFGLGSIPPFVNIVLIFLLFILLYGFCKFFADKYRTLGSRYKKINTGS